MTDLSLCFNTKPKTAGRNTLNNTFNPRGKGTYFKNSCEGKALKSVHFKKTVAQSSFLSKVLSFLLKSKQSQRKWQNAFERNEDCATVFLKWTDFSITKGGGGAVIRVLVLPKFASFLLTRGSGMKWICNQCKKVPSTGIWHRFHRPTWLCFSVTAKQLEQHW